MGALLLEMEEALMFKRQHDLCESKYADLILKHQDLRRMYDLEVAAHRGNCVTLNEEFGRRLDAERDLAQVVAMAEIAALRAAAMTEAFRVLHDGAHEIS